MSVKSSGGVRRILSEDELTSVVEYIEILLEIERRQEMKAEVLYKSQV